MNLLNIDVLGRGGGGGGYHPCGDGRGGVWRWSHSWLTADTSTYPLTYICMRTGKPTGSQTNI